jgi:MYXO-CTERM domain-containing protein
VPSGTYRFVVDGNIHAAGAPTPYELTSSEFQVTPWEGLKAADPQVVNGDVVVATDPVIYPRTYTPDPSFHFVKDDGGDVPSGAGSAFCRTCSFRPWARTGTVESVAVTVVQNGVAVRTVPAVKQADGSWVAATALQPGEVAFVNKAGVRDGYGEINGTPTKAVDAGGVLSDPPAIDPGADVPEVPMTALLPLAGLLMLAVAWAVRRRRGAVA